MLLKSSRVSQPDALIVPPVFTFDFYTSKHPLIYDLLSLYVCAYCLVYWGTKPCFTVWIDLAEISHGNTSDTSDAMTCKHTCIHVCVLEQN